MIKIKEALFVRNRDFPKILLIIIAFSGLLGSSTMILEELPAIDLATVVVTTAWDGAAPEELEESISRKIEAAIEDVDGIDSYTIVSSKGLCEIIIDVQSGFDYEDVFDDVESSINEITTFPAGAEAPVVKMG